MVFLEVHELNKRFGGLVAIQNVSFQINKNEILGIIGPNGAGKTTLFNMISGFLRPDSGSIIFNGEDITNLDASKVCRKGIAKTFQLSNPFLSLTAFTNVVTGALLRSEMPKAKKEAAYWLDFVGLGKKCDVVTEAFNIAERKQVDLARALATKPDLLLVDEIFAGLNPDQFAETIEMIQKIKHTGVTLCLIEHVMKAIMIVCGRIIVLHHGEKIAEGTPQEIATSKRVVEVYLGE